VVRGLEEGKQKADSGCFMWAKSSTAEITNQKCTRENRDSIEKKPFDNAKMCTFGRFIKPIATVEMFMLIDLPEVRL